MNVYYQYADKNLDNINNIIYGATMIEIATRDWSDDWIKTDGGNLNYWKKLRWIRTKNEKKLFSKKNPETPMILNRSLLLKNYWKTIRTLHRGRL